jgi:peptide/nickel transport system substrate-binding protein
MRKRLFGLLATTAIVFAACQGAASPSPSEPGASTEPSAAPASPSPEPTPIDYEALLFGYEYEPTAGTPGGKVIISDWQAANQLNPWYSNAFANTQVYASTMRGLWLVTSDGHYKVDLAEKMPLFSDDTIRPDASGTGFEVDITLKPNLKWSDGTPFTTADIEYTWQWVLDPANVGVTTLGWDVIDKMTVKDDLNVTVHFKEAFAGFYGTLSGYYLPKHYMSTIPVADAPAKSYPLSPDIAKSPTIGPFKYVTASADTIELVRDDNWAGPAEACDGKACLDAVTYKFFPDNKEGMIAAFLAGEIDVALDLVQADYDAIKVVDPSIGKAILEPAWLYEHFDMNQAGLGQGLGHPALKDLKVRQAIAQAIDKEAMYQTVFPGAPVPDYSLCVNATPTNYWQLPDAECLTFDLAAANALLDEAGYKDGNGDGTREDPAGNELVFEHCTSTAGFRQTGGEFLKKSLAEIGVTLNLNFVDSTTVFFANWPDVAPDTKCNLAHGQYDTAEFAYVLSFDLFGNYYYSYHSEQIPTDANSGDGYNYLRFINQNMDDSLNVLRSSILLKDQLEAVWTVQQVYIDEVPEVVLYYRNEARGVSVKLNNFFKNPSTSSDMWNVEDWWVTQ